MFFRKSQVAKAIASAVILSAVACPVMGSSLEPVKRVDWFGTLAASVDDPLFREAAGTGLNALVDFGDADSTFCAWVRTDRDGTIFAKMPVWGRDRGRSKLVFVRRGRLAMENLYSFYMESSKPINDGQWRHVAIVRRPSAESVTMFIDGIEDRSGKMRHDADNRDHFVRIGHGFHNYPEPSAFVGDLDEVRVYGRALSPEEIKSLFDSPADALNQGLLARWSFDGTSKDASGKGVDLGDLRFAEYVEGKAGQAIRLSGKGWAMAPVTPMQKLWYEVWGLFPDPASRQQMDWELTDGIWASLWNPGVSVEIARRYAAAYVTANQDELESVRKRAEEVKDQAGLDGIRKLYLTSKRRDQLVKRINGSNPESLRNAILALGRTGNMTNQQVTGYLARLDGLEKDLAKLESTTIADAAEEERVIAGFQKLQREALLQNKLFDFDKLVFVRRYTFTSNHYYTDYINGCSKYGGNLCILDMKTGAVTELVSELKTGIFGAFDLSFDAKKIVFAWKSEPMKGFRIYEVGIDGKGLRQLTFPPDNENDLIRLYKVGYHHGTDDMDPIYLPDGGICFISTRCQYGILCDSPDDFTTTVLYRMDADGGNMEKLTNSSVSENTPRLTNDGRIMYTRWEYVDKGASATKCLWAMRPDGTGSSEIYGNAINLPPTFVNGRPIPGDNNKFVVVGAPHFPGNRVGTIIRLDITKDIRTREPMTYLTPVDIRGEGGWCDLRNGEWIGKDIGPMYAEPFPLSESAFLVSYNPDKFWCHENAYGIYLLDEYGNHVKIHTDSEMSCWQPTPLKPREKPPVLQSVRRQDLAEKDLALVVVTDIYQGMEGVKRGEIKYIRINEQVPRPWAARRRWDGDLCDQQHSAISWKANLGLRAQHGVVPVEADGSAYFYVPADRNVFFQALDANFMEVQRERTYVNYRPGETRSCVGCHDQSSKASPASQQVPMALKRQPSKPGPQPGEVTGRRPLYYAMDVQPVFDKHCVGCHSGEKPKGNLDLSGEMTDQFNRSYEQIISKGLIKNIPEIYGKCDNVHYLPAKSLGSHVSKLVQVLVKGHKDVKLTREEMIKITTWVDANGQYYGGYYGRRNLKYEGAKDFRPILTFDEVIATECPPRLVTWTQ